MPQTVVFDFDGVIHSYTSGWKGPEVIPDPPVPGIKEAIAEIRADGRYLVKVVSTRCATLRGLQAVTKYLDQHGIEVDDICEEKPPAIAYIDDRAICFDGHPETLLGKIQAFQPWNKKEAADINVPTKGDRFRATIETDKGLAEFLARHVGIMECPREVWNEVEKNDMRYTEAWEKWLQLPAKED